MQAVIGFVLGLISALVVNFFIHKLAIRRERTSLLQSQKIKSFSEIIPLLFFPRNHSVSEDELISVFSSTILVADKNISEKLNSFLEEIIESRHSDIKARSEGKFPARLAKESRTGHWANYKDRYDELNDSAYEILELLKKSILL